MIVTEKGKICPFFIILMIFLHAPYCIYRMIDIVGKKYIFYNLRGERFFI